MAAVAGLRTEDVTKSFRGWDARPVPVLRGVSLAVRPGTLTLVRGAPGAGRTTLLRCLYGTYRPDRGRVLVTVGADELDIVAAPDRTVAWVRRTMLAAFDGALVTPPRTTARRAVARASKHAAGPGRLPHGSEFGTPDGDQTGGGDRSQPDDWLGAVGAGAWADVPVGRLRPDERRRVALAVALATPAPVLLLDEPLADLPAPAGRAVCRLLAARMRLGGAVLATAAAGSGEDLDALASVSHTVEMGRITCTS